MDPPPARRALIECVERDARLSRSVDVHAWPLTIGRALDNDLVIDDPFAAAHHARLELDAEGGLQLVVLPGINGVMHGRRHVAPGQTLRLAPADTVLQIGHARLRLRLPGEALAPERPLPARGSASVLVPLASAGVLVVLQVLDRWLALDPGADYSAWLAPLVGLPVAVACWCGVWALMSKVFQHRFDFAGHLRIALPWMLAIALFATLWPQAMASLDAPGPWQLGPPLEVLLLAALVTAHLRHLLPLHRAAVGVTVVAVVVAGGAISMALTHRSTDRYFGAPYMSTLPIPALRLAGSVPSKDLVQAMQPLARTLALRVKQARAEDDEAGGDEDEE